MENAENTNNNINTKININTSVHNNFASIEMRMNNRQFARSTLQTIHESKSYNFNALDSNSFPSTPNTPESIKTHVENFKILKSKNSAELNFEKFDFEKFDDKNVKNIKNIKMFNTFCEADESMIPTCVSPKKEL